MYPNGTDLSQIFGTDLSHVEDIQIFRKYFLSLKKLFHGTDLSQISATNLSQVRGTDLSHKVQNFGTDLSQI